MRNTRGGCLESTPTPPNPPIFIGGTPTPPPRTGFGACFDFFDSTSLHIFSIAAAALAFVAKRCSGAWGTGRGGWDCRFYLYERDRVISGLDKGAFQALFLLLLGGFFLSGYVFPHVCCICTEYFPGPPCVCACIFDIPPEMGAVGWGRGGVGKQMIIDYSAFFVFLLVQILGASRRAKKMELDWCRLTGDGGMGIWDGDGIVYLPT